MLTVMMRNVGFVVTVDVHRARLGLAHDVHDGEHVTRALGGDGLSEGELAALTAIDEDRDVAGGFRHVPARVIREEGE